jgi:hypothetical protein
MRRSEIERIADMLAEGMTPSDIAEQLNLEKLDTLSADAEDDSDDGIGRRYGISCDDRYDTQGRELLPRLNDAGEPNWF